MTALQQAEQLLPAMTPTEKVQLLERIARDLSGIIPGIDRTPGICGGAARVSGTRIPVWTLVRFHQLGMSDAELLAAYPTLQAQNLTNAWAYYHLHSAEVEREVYTNEELLGIEGTFA